MGFIRQWIDDLFGGRSKGSRTKVDRIHQTPKMKSENTKRQNNGAGKSYDYPHVTTDYKDKKHFSNSKKGKRSS